MSIRCHFQLSNILSSKGNGRTLESFRWVSDKHIKESKDKSLTASVVWGLTKAASLLIYAPNSDSGISQESKCTEMRLILCKSS